MVERWMWLALAVTGMLILSACYFWEPEAPQRTFTPGDLLVGAEAFPPSWQAFDPYFPAGDDLCTGECAAVQFSVPDAESPGPLATQSVFRYKSTGIAQRTFDKIYSAKTRSLDPVAEWTFQSSVAQQSHFGCGAMAGNVGKVCVWAGRYEEFIIVFRTQIDVADMSLAALEAVVKSIDRNVASHLGELPPSETPVP